MTIASYSYDPQMWWCRSCRAVYAKSAFSITEAQVHHDTHAKQCPDIQEAHRAKQADKDREVVSFLAECLGGNGYEVTLRLNGQNVEIAVSDGYYGNLTAQGVDIYDAAENIRKYITDAGWL